MVHCGGDQYHKHQCRNAKHAQIMMAIGLVQEVVGTGIAINALWPATLTESFATTNFKMSESREWRKASIISDCVLKIVEETPEMLNGNAVVDEDYLKSRGVVDFSQYQRVSQSKPIKVWPPKVWDEWFKFDGEGVPPGVQARL